MIQSNEVFVDPNTLILGDYSPDTQRLNELIASVKDNGRLLHTPYIKDNLEVIAGKLRVMAAQKAGLTIIKCEQLPSDLHPDEYEAIHLHEQLMRHNLPWWEIVTEEKRLHELRMRQVGLDSRGTKGKKAAWGLRETALELNISLGLLSEDIRMADAIILDPKLKNISDKMTARKIINEGIKRLHQEIGACTPTNIDVNVIHLGHSDAILNLYPNSFFDACITDPPWLEFKDDRLTRDEYTLPVFHEIYRTLKNNSFLYAFVSTQDWYFYQDELAKIGFNVQKFPLIWVKTGSLSQGRRTWEYQRDYEPIILAVKGSPAVSDSMLSSVLTTRVVPSQRLTHPNEKPEEIIKKLLEHCTYDDSIVLDPFAGSFVVPYCCKQMNRRYVAIEREPKFFAKGQERLK